MNFRARPKPWIVIFAEISPIIAGTAAVLGYWAVASWVPDGRVADRIDCLFWAVGGFGFCACGIGWLLAGDKAVAVTLFVSRSVLMISGLWLLGLGLAPVCDSPCGPSWVGESFPLFFTSGLAMSAIALGMPFVSVSRLAGAMPR